MTERPTVSVIIPTYNRRRLLRQAIESVARQTFEDWEIVIADDGSTDETAAMVTGLQHPRVALHLYPHIGNVARMRNAAVANSSGEWIAFLDSDDLWRPKKLELQLRALAESSQCEWSCTGFDFVDDAGDPVTQRAGVQYSAQSGWILDRLLVFTATATIQSLLVRRSAFDSIGGFDEELRTREDYDLELRLAERSEICALPEPLTRIREHAARTSSDDNVIAMLEANERVFRKAERRVRSAASRALCVRQRARQFLQMAQLQSRDGAHWAALGSSRRGIGCDPSSWIAWAVGARALLRTLRIDVTR